MWEGIFMLLVLKIPVVYLALVVWWAIRAEPHPGAPAALVPTVADTPPGLSPRARRESPPRASGGRSGPSRRPSRGRLAPVRAEARR